MGMWRKYGVTGAKRQELIVNEWTEGPVTP